MIDRRSHTGAGQWRSLIEDVTHNPGELMDVITDIAAFLMPHAVVAASRGK
jgi:hypothetical protein